MDNFMDTLADRYNAQEMIRANSQADTMQMEGLEEQVEAYEAVLQEMRKLNYKNAELTEKMYTLVDESIEKVRTLSIEAKEGDADAAAISKEMSESVTDALNEAMSQVIASTNALADKVEEIKEQTAASNANAGQTDTFAAESINAGIASVNDNIAVLNASVNDNIANLNADMTATSSAVASVKEKTDTIDTYVRGLFESVEATKSALLKLSEKTAESSDQGQEVDSEALNNAMASIDELKESIRTLKAGQDESKNSLKTSFDSAIYGLKQDNREIVEFMQRMNSNIVAKNDDSDKEQREQEALEREQENKKAFEERIKTNEDFMHRESVKVYRNVQAVINEKIDIQTEALEMKVKKNAALMNQVKILAIFAVILGGVDMAGIIAILLKLFGVL
ncbi:MAG: hypothetical protein IKR70_01720, partial [Lachnospiraceae bacterium]|nr:hypothetical protein [Lachnospiraceae bacterium]